MQSTIQYINNECHCLELINGLFIGQHWSTRTTVLFRFLFQRRSHNSLGFKNPAGNVQQMQLIVCQKPENRKKDVYRSSASGSGRNVKRNCANVDCIAEAFAISNQKNLCKGEGNAGKPDMHTTKPNRAHTFPVCPLQISQAMFVLYKQD